MTLVSSVHLSLGGQGVLPLVPPGTVLLEASTELTRETEFLSLPN